MKKVVIAAVAAGIVAVAPGSANANPFVCDVYDAVSGRTGVSVGYCIDDPNGIDPRDLIQPTG